jgi:hypothetical protein
MRHFYVLMLLLSPIIAVAQQLPLGQAVMNDFNILIQGADTTLYTGYRASDWLEFRYALDSERQTEGDKMFGLGTDTKKSFGQRIFSDHWFRYQNNDFLLTADPYLDATGSKSSEKEGILWNGTAGLRIRGAFRNRLSFGLGGYTSLSEFPAYLDKFIQENESMIPGRNQGQLKDEGRYAYSNIDAYLTYMPDEHISLTAGYGKQFIGDGYRSLLWSDNAFNYPYVRLRASFWKLHYNVMYSYLENDRMVDGVRQGKYSVSHLLGINIGKRLQVSLFENILWLARDTNYQRGFDVQYLNPFTFMRPVEFSLGSPDNSFFGLNWKYIIPKAGYVYGQLALDDINISETFKNNKQHINNKYGIQLGIWTHDVFLKGLSWRLEWNAVRPYMYGHRKPDQNYTHNHQALAHPFGANFHEFLSIFNYRYNRWYGVLHNALVIRGEDSTLGYNNGNDLWGGEAGVPLLGSKTMQGIRNNYWYNRLSLGYMLNPANRLSVQMDIIYRSRSATAVRESEWYYGLGIRTGLFNRQDDL